MDLALLRVPGICAASHESEAKTMRMTFGWLVAACFIFLSATPSYACSRLPWDYARLASDSEALIHGKVIRVKDGGRVATLSVTSYVGQGTAPREVRVGPTEYSGSAKYGCPDSSVIFREDQDYLVFLSEGSPAFRLIYPQGATAIPVSSHRMVAVHENSDQKEPANSLIRSFGQSHDLPVQSPKWTPVLPAIVAVLLPTGVGGLTWSWFRRRSSAEVSD